MAALEVLPFLVALVEGEPEAASAFGSSIVLTLFIGGGFFLGFRSAVRVPVKVASIFLPLLAGLAIGTAVAFPFYFMHFDRGPFAALYEGISMLTTNGASAYTDDEPATHAESLWRAIIAWCGGLISVALTLSILTSLNSGGLQAYKSKLQLGDSGAGAARLRSTVRALVPAYFLVTLICLTLLIVSGMDPFNSLVVAMGTISTTGISHDMGNKVLGLGPQIIVLIFMVMASLHWDYFYAKLKQARNVRFMTTETKQVMIMALLGGMCLTVLPKGESDYGAWDALFLSVSALSTTGYVTDTLELDGVLLPLSISLFILAAIGGTVTGTGGGIKQLRFRVLTLLARSELRRLAHPHGVVPIKLSGVRLAKQDIESVWLLFGSFMIAMVFICIVFAVFGMHFQDAIVLAFTGLTLSGPLATSIDPTFAGFSGLADLDYLILSFVMLFGRVEMSVFMALLARTFWQR
ncbi:TrkH family potassium uptake protein [Kordiimonas sediminis]|uniref:TrkH family potassium uptake protein n=1 Tax=Kordiimonas sediminis TaxID=1735581 RepID=UPI001748D56B|nr:TrkH family potassium uptake protein [Kordiimonas sediminis]